LQEIKFCKREQVFFEQGKGKSFEFSFLERSGAQKQQLLKTLKITLSIKKIFFFFAFV